MNRQSLNQNNITLEKLHQDLENLDDQALRQILFSWAVQEEEGARQRACEIALHFLKFDPPADLPASFDQALEFFNRVKNDEFPLYASCYLDESGSVLKAEEFYDVLNLKEYMNRVWHLAFELFQNGEIKDAYTLQKEWFNSKFAIIDALSGEVYSNMVELILIYPEEESEDLYYGLTLYFFLSYLKNGKYGLKDLNNYERNPFPELLTFISQHQNSLPFQNSRWIPFLVDVCCCGGRRFWSSESLKDFLPFLLPQIHKEEMNQLVQALGFQNIRQHVEDESLLSSYLNAEDLIIYAQNLFCSHGMIDHTEILGLLETAYHCASEPADELMKFRILEQYNQLETSFDSFAPLFLAYANHPQSVLYFQMIALKNLGPFQTERRISPSDLAVLFFSGLLFSKPSSSSRLSIKGSQRRSAEPYRLMLYALYLNEDSLNEHQLFLLDHLSQTLKVHCRKVSRFAEQEFYEDAEVVEEMMKVYKHLHPLTLGERSKMAKNLCKGLKSYCQKYQNTIWDPSPSIITALIRLSADIWIDLFDEDLAEREEMISQIAVYEVWEDFYEYD